MPPQACAPSTGTDREPAIHGPRIILVHSPITGPGLWAGVRDALWSMGLRAYIARLPAAEHIQPPFWLCHAAGVAAALPNEDSIVLVGHSGAGALLPAIGRLARNRAANAHLAGYIFVDSDLPRDGCSRLDLFDRPEDADAVRQRSRDGWLEPWNDGQLAQMLPDASMRAAFVAELPRTPLALYEEFICVPDDWPEAPCAYLQLSDHYRNSVAAAKRARWPRQHLSGHHLMPLTDPLPVARALQSLIGALH